MGSLAVFGITNDGLNLVVSLLILFLLVTWLALVYWTYADARRRIDDPLLVGCATAAAMFPFAGTMVYMIVRPPERIEDRRERELDMAAAEARLASIEHLSCPYCAFEIEQSFLRCPSCLRRLKEPCLTCGKPLDPRWKICPYCEADIGQAAPQPRRRERARPRERAAPAPETGAGRTAAASGAGRKVRAQSGVTGQVAGAARSERQVAAAADAGGQAMPAAEAPRRAAPRKAKASSPARAEDGAARTPREKSRPRPAADGGDNQRPADGAKSQRPAPNNRQKRAARTAADEPSPDAATAEQPAVRPRTRPPSAG